MHETANSFATFFCQCTALEIANRETEHFEKWKECLNSLLLKDIWQTNSQSDFNIVYFFTRSEMNNVKIRIKNLTTECLLLKDNFKNCNNCLFFQKVQFHFLNCLTLSRPTTARQAETGCPTNRAGTIKLMAAEIDFIPE